LLLADLFYLGRGWTIPLLNKIDETNATPYLLQAFEKGAMIAGFSTGAHALFTLAGSNEEKIGYVLVEGLNLRRSYLVESWRA